MTCDCEIVDKQSIINFICEEIQDLEMDDPWSAYLEFINDRFKTATIAWTFTSTNTRKWFERVLSNMTKEELIFWAHKEMFCIDQVIKKVIVVKD